MKKVVAVFTVFILVLGTSFSVEASIFGKLKQKVADKVKGRKNDDVSNKLNEIASTLTQLGSNLKSSGTSQEKYVNSQYLLAEEDLSFLDAYSVFAKISGDFFSNFGSKIEKLRTEYASLLGAQNRSSQVDTESDNSNQSTNELKVESKTANIQKILKTLISNGFNAMHTNLQCSAVILLKIMKNHPLPEANKAAVQKQIKALHQKYGPFLSLLSDDLVDNMKIIKEKNGLKIKNFESLMQPLVQTITIIYCTINILPRYVSETHDDRLLEEIEKVINMSPYYKSARNEEDADASYYSDDDRGYDADDEWDDSGYDADDEDGDSGYFFD